MSDHIGDDAELYALGVLDENEREAIDAHLATCGECSHLVAQAERVSLALSAMTHAREPIALARYLVAAACVAAVALGALFARERSAANALRASDDVAFASIASSHFLHASFERATVAAAPAKVLYARDGSWLFVVVDGDAAGERIVDADAPDGSVLGVERARGATAAAFVRPGHPVRKLILEDPHGRALATVTLTYPRATP